MEDMRTNMTLRCHQKMCKFIKNKKSNTSALADQRGSIKGQEAWGKQDFSNWIRAFKRLSFPEVSMFMGFHERNCSKI